jgi:ADP-ribose pyrophosphatase YjhB (NUDIX family)
VAVSDPGQQQPQQPQQVKQLLKAAAAGQAAKTAVVAPAVAVTLPARAAIGAVKVPAELLVHGVKVAVILRVLHKLLRWHTTDSVDWLTRELMRLFPDADPAVIRSAVEREMKLERIFQQKALKRVQAALTAAGELPTIEQQQAKVQAILKLEAHYTQLREKTMMERAKAHIANAQTKARSPAGARWVLGPTKNHTLGCLALAGKTWPWSILDSIQPPLHPGCLCSLVPLAPGDPPPPPAGDALDMAKAAMQLEEAIRAVADPGEIEAFLDGEEVRPSIARALRQLQEVNWKDWLHPRGRGGEWIGKGGGSLFDFDKHEGPKPPHVADKPHVPKVDPHMPDLSPESIVVSGPKAAGDTIIGGDKPEPTSQGPIPDFGHIPLALHLPPAFGSDTIKAKGQGDDYFVKDHGGDHARVASELLSNAVYRTLGIDTPTMGHVQTPPEPDFSQRADDLPNEPPIDVNPGARISTGIILREPDGRVTVIEPRNHYGGYIHTFPKGGVEPNLTPQQNAHKELWEETGLHAHITGVVGDFKGDTGTSRFYVGVRTGGEATPSDETQAIKTVTPDEAAKMLNKPRDQEVLKALLEQPIPKGEFKDELPPEEPGSALAFKALTGTKAKQTPTAALGDGYMADALLANRDLSGVRYANDNTPIRTSMASTLGYGKGSGDLHAFNDTPEEVWRMRYRAGTIPQSEDALRQQADHIAKTLTDAKIEELTKAAPYANEEDRKLTADTLKARVAWMRRFASGEESLPQPVSGQEARTMFTDAQDGFDIYPEEQQALETYAGDAGRTLDEHLRSGKDFTSPERQTVKHLDSVLGATKTPENSYVYMGADAAPNEGMVGKAFSMKSYIRAHSDIANTVGNSRVRLLVPGGGRMLHLDEAPKGQPDMILPRDQRMQIVGLRTDPDGKKTLDAILLPHQNPRSLPSAYVPPAQTGLSQHWSSSAPKVIFKKGDRVDVNGNKATVTGDAGKGMANVKLDSGKGYTVPFSILKRLEEAEEAREFVRWVSQQRPDADFDPLALEEAYIETLHPRGRGGRWVDEPSRGLLAPLRDVLTPRSTPVTVKDVQQATKGKAKELRAAGRHADAADLEGRARQWVRDERKRQKEMAKYKAQMKQAEQNPEFYERVHGHPPPFADVLAHLEKTRPELMQPHGARRAGTLPDPYTGHDRPRTPEEIEAELHLRPKPNTTEEFYKERAIKGDALAPFAARHELPWRKGDTGRGIVIPRTGEIYTWRFGKENTDESWVDAPSHQQVAEELVRQGKLGPDEPFHGVVLDGQGFVGEPQTRNVSGNVDPKTWEPVAVKRKSPEARAVLQQVADTIGGTPYPPLKPGQKWGSYVQEASFRDFLHPRGRGGEWIESGRHLTTATNSASAAIKKITAPPPKEHSLARIEALGIEVVPPGKHSKIDAQELADIAGVLEDAFKQYPILSNGPGAPLKKLMFASNPKTGKKMKPGVLADCGITQMTHKQGGWNVPVGGRRSVITLNDRYDYHLKPSGPPPPNATIGGGLSVSSRSWAGVTWHELGHAMINAIDMGGHHDAKRYADWMNRYGITFEDCKGISTYAVASRSEGIAELCSMENTPGFKSLMPPDLQPKVEKMFSDLRNWDVTKPYAYQKPLPGSTPTPTAAPKPLPKIKAPSKPSTYKLPSNLSDIEAKIKANPGTAGPKQPVADLHLTPGDVIEGGTPGLRYLIITDPSQKAGLRYVSLNQGTPTAFKFSGTSTRRKVNQHFDLQESAVTLDLSPEAVRKAQAAAEQNLAAGDWVAPDPFLDDGPTDVEEADYAEALHPRGRGGKWIRKLGEMPKAPETPEDRIVGSLKGRTGDEAYQALARGEATDTQHIHQVNGAYTAARQLQHQAIIDHFFAHAKPAKGKAKAIFTAGGAASGKSTLAGQSSHTEANLDIPKGAVYINPDDIKEMLPEYKHLKERGREDVAAAAVHEESSDLAKLMTRMAMNGNYHIIVDGTGDSKVGKFGDKLRAAQRAGYDVEARYAHVPVSEALKREKDRAKRTGRKVAESLLREQHRTVARSYVEDVSKIPDVHVKVYSTVKRGKPDLIAEKPPGKEIQVKDKKQYDQHVAKVEGA